jgi:hypothetical protein
VTSSVTSEIAEVSRWMSVKATHIMSCANESSSYLRTHLGGVVTRIVTGDPFMNREHTVLKDDPARGSYFTATQSILRPPKPRGVNPVDVPAPARRAMRQKHVP